MKAKGIKQAKAWSPTRQPGQAEGHGKHERQQQGTSQLEGQSRRTTE